MKVYCGKCGAIIPEGRLKALPNTKSCIDCSNVKVKKAIQTTGGSGDHTWNDIQVVTEEEYEIHNTYEKHHMSTLNDIKNNQE
jgi:RNA polymerase-binding transcription factor DksA